MGRQSLTPPKDCLLALLPTYLKTEKLFVRVNLGKTMIIYYIISFFLSILFLSKTEKRSFNLKIGLCNDAQPNCSLLKFRIGFDTLLIMFHSILNIFYFLLKANRSLEQHRIGVFCD